MTNSVSTTMSETAYHIPALLPQTLECLDIKPDGIYVDATFGGGAIRGPYWRGSVLTDAS